MPFSRLATLSARFVPPEPDLRKLIAIRLAASIGRGAFLSGSAVYFTLSAGLSATQIGLGVSAAGLSGFVASLVFGMISDRVGARRLLCALFALQAVGFVLFLAVDTAIKFYVLVVSLGFVEYGTGPATGALIGTIVSANDRVRVKAIMRTAFNIGFSVGSGVAALATLQRGFLGVIPLSTAALMAAATVLVLRLPVDQPRKPTPAGFRRFSAVRDRRFVAVIAVSTVLASHVSIILVTMPLWALNRTAAPHFIIPLLLAFNTTFVILFQVRASAGADTVQGAGHLARRSGLWLATGCGVVAVTALTRSVAATSVVFIAAVLVFSIAEVMQSAAGWGLAFGLAPEHAQGEYLGTFDLHVVTQNVIGPAILAGLVIALGFWGWMIVAAGVLVASVLIVPVARRSESWLLQRTAPAAEEPRSVLAG